LDLAIFLFIGFDVTTERLSQKLGAAQQLPDRMRKNLWRQKFEPGCAIARFAMAKAVCNFSSRSVGLPSVFLNVSGLSRSGVFALLGE
jgi:hypothetical protein